MRGFLHHGLLYQKVLLFVFLVFIQGCTRTLLQTYPASEQEIAAVSQAFVRFQEISSDSCGCCLDAEADAALSVSGWFSDHTGKLSGYLQAMKPGYIRFVALNPLGQPFFIFVTDGSMFKGLNVLEEKAYLGFVQSDTFMKFAPPGFKPQFSYYLLTGRVPPGDIRIQAVMRARDQENRFWLQIKQADTLLDGMVLFDAEELMILRHVLRNEQGEHIADILYGDYVQLSGREFCRVPASIAVSSSTNAGKIEIKLYSFLDGTRLSADNFNVMIPDNFQQLLVK